MPTILIADDSPTTREMLAAILEGDGYRVILAEDGVQAAERALALRPDLIVLDVQMPRMNGYQVCRLLKDEELTQDIPIVMFTSQDDRTDTYWGLKTGAAEHLSKDFDPPEFLRVIRSVLERFPVSQSGVKGNAPEATVVDVISKANDLTERKFLESALMNEISQVARYLNDLVETAHGVMGVVLNVFGHYAAAIGIVSDDGVDLVIRSDHRLARRYVQEIRQRVQESLSSLAGLTVSGPLRLVVRDCAKGATQSAELSSLTTPLVSIPLKQRDIPLGFFFLNPRSPTGLKQVELRVLRSLVDQIAVIVENARLHQKVRRMSITDPLTGLANRQHFHDELEREFARARRYSIPFSLLMIDIDHFKVLNDSYGHQQGDLVLRELAAMLERQVRGGDLVARYGGEEFAVVLPQARPPEARAIAERVRQELEGFSFPGLPHPISVTVSIGVASFPSPLVAAPDDLVRRADVFLYQAKRGGRNQVQVEAGEISTDAPGGENTPPSAAGSRA